MKILQISPQVPYPATDGGKISIISFTKALFNQGHKVYFVAYSKHADVDYSKKGLSIYSEPTILDVKTDNSLIGAIRNVFSTVPYNISKYRSKKMIAFLEEFIPVKKPDLVIIHNLHMGWVVNKIRKLDKNILVILREENIEMFIMKRYYENQKNLLLKFFAYVQYAKFKFYEPRLCEKFDECLFITKNDERQIQNYSKNIKSSVIPIGINSELLKVKKQVAEEYSLVHIGHLDWYPNKDGLSWFISDILPLIIKKIPQIKLYVYGGGTTKLFKVPSQFQKYVQIVGFVDDIWKEVITKDLAIVPLRVGSGIRVKIIEMLAVGQNVITTTIGKEGINCIDGEHLLIADSVEEFSDKITNFFEDKYDKKNMSSKGKQLVQDSYTLDRIAADLDNLIYQMKKNKGFSNEQT